MKKLILFIACATITWMATAQNYVTLTDTVWGCRYFALDPSTGQPSSTGNKTGKSGITWPSKANI